MRDVSPASGSRTPSDHNRIVVGVDGSAPSWDALHWAVGEAYHWRAALELLMVDRDHAAGVAENRLGHMVTEARRLEPSVRVTGNVCRGEVVRELGDAARNARMVVVGHRGRGGIGRLLAGSTGLRIADEATVPVAVVQGHLSGPGPIVVGVDGSSGSEAALGVALDEARRSGRVAVAVFAYWPPFHTVFPAGQPLPSDPQLLHASACAALESTLAPWREKFPDIDIMTVTTATPATSALADLSRRAHLVVVGAHGHDRPTGPIGSVPEKLVRRAHCPVLVVR